MGSEKKGIHLLPDLLGKGYISKALRQAWLTWLLGVDTLGVQVGLQHLSLQIYGQANYALETITNVAAVVYRVLDQRRLL